MQFRFLSYVVVYRISNSATLRGSGRRISYGDCRCALAWEIGVEAIAHSARGHLPGPDGTLMMLAQALGVDSVELFERVVRW